jgi:hypothetical protein
MTGIEKLDRMKGTRRETKSNEREKQENEIREGKSNAPVPDRGYRQGWQSPRGCSELRKYVETRYGNTVMEKHWGAMRHQCHRALTHTHTYT